MTRVVQFMRDLVAKGMSWEDAALFAERFEEGLDMATTAAAISPALEKKRQRDRDRYWRNKGESGAESAGETVSEIAGETGAESDAKDAPAPVHTRGEDNPSTVVDLPYLTTPDSASAFANLDWPEGDKPSRTYLDQLEDALRDAAGAALASPAIAPKVKVLTPILALGRPGKGPPCDMQADVLPTVRARSARAPPGSVKSWDFFTEAILEARDKRLSGARAVEPIRQGNHHGRPDQPSRKFSAKQANMERAFAGAQRAIARGAR
jgi:hypothetical protein